MTVAEMLARMSSVEFSEWIAFNAIEPLGDERADLRAGIITAVLANYISQLGARIVMALCGSKLPITFRKPSEFMPFVERPPEPTPLEQDPVAAARAIKAMFGVKGGK